MLSQNYFNLVSHNVYDDLNYLQLSLLLAKEEFESNSKLANDSHRKIFLTNSISNHYYLFNACLEHNLLKDIFSLKNFLKYIKEKFKTYSSFINHKTDIRKQILTKIKFAFSYIWPNEFSTIGLYKNDSLEKITIYDYCVFVLNHTYRTIKDIKNLFPDVYNYILSLYPLPNEDDFEQPPLSGYIYMFKHQLSDYPRTLVTNKYAKFNKALQQFYVFDDFEQAFKSKKGIEYTNKKRIQANLEHFGKEWPMQLEETKEKTKQTFKEKFGVDYISQNKEIKEKIKHTNIEKYGVENPIQNKEVREKMKQTNIKRYGYENPLNSPQIKEKVKQTNIERYGYEYPSQSNEIKEKISQTKRKNKSFNTSSSEEIIYKKLCMKFGINHIIRQYNDKRYQFDCDFYIDIFDLFIEFQGTWFHGIHPFNDKSEDDLAEVLKMKDRLDAGHISYNHAIHIWTTRDPLKRQTAKENNLNFIELWTLEEALEFIDDLPWITSI